MAGGIRCLESDELAARDRGGSSLSMCGIAGYATSRVDTGLDVDALIRAALLVESMIGREVPSRVAHAGPRSRRAGDG